MADDDTTVARDGFVDPSPGTRRPRRATVARDGCAVPTAPLTAILDQWSASFILRHPQTTGQFAPEGGRKEDGIRPLDYLAHETGIGRGTLQNIMRGRYPTTELKYADAIITVLGCVQVFDNEIPIIPNPGASRKAREACCSGCLTGLVTPAEPDA